MIDWYLVSKLALTGLGVAAFWGIVHSIQDAKEIWKNPEQKRRKKD